MGNGITRLWGYTLAEVVAKTQQRLHVPRPYSLQDATAATTTTAVSIKTEQRSCGGGGARATLNPETTRSLRDECLSRGLPLESVILASLFVAAAEALRVSGQTAATGTAAAAPAATTATTTATPAVAVVDPQETCHDKNHDGDGYERGTTNASTSTRLQRGSVLGLVSVVMALLSGSVDSKALRYFCSFYAVFAGGWAVNVITVAAPGFMFLMSTSAADGAKVGKDGAADGNRNRGPTFAPVRLAVDSRRRGLWDTAERHRRGSLGISLSEQAFGRFKRRSRGVRGAWRCCCRWWQQRLGRKMAGATMVVASSASEKQDEERPPPFQLFGCIQEGRRVVDAASAPLSTPAEVFEVEGGSRAGGSVVDCGGDGDGDGDIAALLSILESRYTLIYRRISTAHPKAAASSSCGSSSDGGSLGDTEDNNCRATGSDVGEQTPPAGLLPERLELWLVEGSGKKGCSQKDQGGHGDGGGDGNGGSMTKWLLEHATAILVDALPCLAPTGRD